jgi:hypothetical protein
LLVVAHYSHYGPQDVARVSESLSRICLEELAEDRRVDCDKGVQAPRISHAAKLGCHGFGQGYRA